jgi:hypothetical protein
VVRLGYGADCVGGEGDRRSCCHLGRCWWEAGKAAGVLNVSLAAN